MTPRDAEIAIVGGGIWGLSAAYHLARAGHTRIRVLERNAAVAAETTPRAARLVGQIRSDATMLGAVQYALDLLGRFADETGHDPGLHQTGSLMVALTDERMAYCQQQVAFARARLQYRADQSARSPVYQPCWCPQVGNYHNGRTGYEVHHATQLPKALAGLS